MEEVLKSFLFTVYSQQNIISLVEKRYRMGLIKESLLKQQSMLVIYMVQGERQSDYSNY